MNRTGHSSQTWLAIVVMVHFLVTIIHGMAHSKANVPLSATGTAFVFLVVLAGPLLGLGITWPYPRAGAGLIGLTLAGAFVFGVLNHFVLTSPDHIAHVDVQWRPLLTTTAVLLGLTEALGAGLAVSSLREVRSS